LESTQKVFSL